MAVSKKEQRQVIDKVLVLLGVVAAVVFVVAGAIAWKGYDFATNQVKTELTAQKIYFPEEGPAIDALPAEDAAEVKKYAGQQLVNGEQAKVYANNYINAHLKEIADGKTYAEVSNEARKDPTNEALKAQKASLFQGETLRGLLLSAGYSYWTMGMLAKLAALVFFAGAAVMALLVVLGLRRISSQK